MLRARSAQTSSPGSRTYVRDQAYRVEILYAPSTVRFPMREAPDGKLADLGAHTPRLSLGVALRDIRDGRPPEQRDRGDVNALAAIFIEETWRSVEKWLAVHGRGLPTKATS